MDIMQTSNTLIKIALPCAGEDEANKYVRVCYKSSSATSCKKNNFNKPLVLMMTNLLKPLLSKSETIPIQIQQQYNIIPST